MRVVEHIRRTALDDRVSMLFLMPDTIIECNFAELRSSGLRLSSRYGFSQIPSAHSVLEASSSWQACKERGAWFVMSLLLLTALH